jgi:hypothetical protein
VRQADRQHRVPGKIPAAGRVEDGLEQRPGHLQLPLQIVDGKVVVMQQIRLDLARVQHRVPPGTLNGR